MIAHRRARYAGRLDVDRMLDEITPEEMDEVEAFERLEPDPFLRIAEILKLGFAVSCLSSNVTPDDFEPPTKTPADGEANERSAPKAMGPRQTRQFLESQ